MSDMKKSLEPIQDLDFSDVSGGTESPVEDVLQDEKPKTEQTVVLKPEEESVKKSIASPASVYSKNAIYLPIPTGDSWVTKSIEDVSGEEFLTWVKSVLPMSENVVPEASKFEGTNGKKKRAEVFQNVVLKHEGVLRRQLSRQKINLDKLKH